jgi:hypothetical protein
VRRRCRRLRCAHPRGMPDRVRRRNGAGAKPRTLALRHSRSSRHCCSVFGKMKCCSKRQRERLRRYQKLRGGNRHRDADSR